MLHNYFPVPKESFVINLASPKRDIVQNSIDFLSKSIVLSGEISSNIFAVHSGFLVDPRPNELGKAFKNYEVTPRGLALEIFLESVSELILVAEENGVQLFVENNVISEANFDKFGEDIFLMTSFSDFDFFMSEFSGQVKFLMDIGHLNVSCNTLKLDKIEQLQASNSITSGYHLHDNLGRSDDHMIFELRNAWFSEYLIKDPEFVTLEVHDYTNPKLKELSENLSKFFT